MNNAVLDRIAAIRPPPPVRIYQLDRGCGVWLWLCEKHLAKRKAAGWIQKEDKDPMHPLGCDDCRREL
jgi:hypothetical protein